MWLILIGCAALAGIVAILPVMVDSEIHAEELRRQNLSAAKAKGRKVVMMKIITISLAIAGVLLIVSGIAHV